MLDRRQSTVPVEDQKALLARVREDGVAELRVVRGDVGRIEPVQRRKLGDEQRCVGGRRNREREVGVRKVVQRVLGQ